MASHYTVPGMTTEEGNKTAAILQERLSSLIDLGLTLKHVHWNVIGANFIAVHEMLDPQYAAVQAMVDDVAERIAALGDEPMGTAGFVAKNRDADDYGFNRASTQDHLVALNDVYERSIAAHRDAMKKLEELDPVSQDIVIGQLEQLEKFHWFVRAHIENKQGQIVSNGKQVKMVAS